MAALQSDIDQFLNQAQVKLTGASDAGVIAATYDVMREWLQSTLAWMELIPITVVSTTQDYAVLPGEGGRIFMLLGVSDAHGCPIGALMPTLGVVSLQHPVTNSVQYNVSVAKTLAPPLTKDGFPIVPDWLLPIYGVGILDGVLGNMMSMSNTSWYDAKWSIYHLKRFQNAMATARTEVLRRRTLGSQAWTYPRSNFSGSQRGGISTGNPTRFT